MSLAKDGHAGARKLYWRGGWFCSDCMDFGRGPVAQGLVGVQVVVEVQVAGYPFAGFLCRGVFAQVNVFILEGSPKAFNKYVVQVAATPVHADAHPGLPQHRGELAAGKLAALIGVEDLRLGPPQSFLQGEHTEAALQGVGKLPAQHVAAELVQHHGQEKESSAQPQVSDVAAPYLVGPLDRQTPQQIRENAVLPVPLAQVSTRINSLQAHLAHEPLDAASSHCMALSTQPLGHPARTKKRILGVELIHAMHVENVLLALGTGPIVIAAAGQPQQLTLPADTDFSLKWLHHLAPLTNRVVQTFFLANRILLSAFQSPGKGDLFPSRCPC